MSQAKPTLKSKRAKDESSFEVEESPSPQIGPEKLHLRGANGHDTPFQYEGKIIRVTPKEVTSLEVSKIPYESMIHINEALKNKSLEKVQGEPKQ